MNRNRNYKFYEESSKIIMSIDSITVAEISDNDVKFKLPFIPDRLKKQLTWDNIEVLKAELVMIIEKWFETKACLDDWNLKPQRLLI